MYYRKLLTPLGYIVICCSFVEADAKTYSSGDLLWELSCENLGSTTQYLDFKKGLTSGQKEKLWENGILKITVAPDLYPRQSLKEGGLDYNFKLQTDNYKTVKFINGRGWVGSNIENPKTHFLVLTEVGGSTLNLYREGEILWLGSATYIDTHTRKGYVENTFVGLRCTTLKKP